MRTIEISDETYEYLLSRVKYLGESADSILQREFGMSPSVSGAATDGSSDGPDPVAFVNSDEFTRRIRTATDRYLAILGWLAEQHPAAFENILELEGRKRCYFGRSESDITRSGKSTHPRQIPGTEYWAMTNSDNNQKRDMLRQAMDVLGYPRNAIEGTVQAI